MDYIIKQEEIDILLNCLNQPKETISKIKEKPPLGIMPKYIWDAERIDNLRNAIDRYTNANLQVPMEWIEEYNDLIKLYKDKE